MRHYSYAISRLSQSLPACHSCFRMYQHTSSQTPKLLSVYRVGTSTVCRINGLLCVDEFVTVTVYRIIFVESAAPCALQQRHWQTAVWTGYLLWFCPRFTNIWCETCNVTSQGFTALVVLFRIYRVAVTSRAQGYLFAAETPCHASKCGSVEQPGPPHTFLVHIRSS